MFPLRQPSIQTSWSISNCCVGYLLCRFADRTPPKNLLSTSYVLFLVFHLDWLCSQGSSNSRALLACGRFATSVSLLINYWTVRKCNAFWSEFIVLPAATCQVGSAGWTRLTWNPRPWMSMVFGTKIISNRDFKRNPGQSQGPLAIVLPLFLLRGALMNARGLSIGNTFQNGVFGNHQPSITSIKYISGFENSIWEGLKLNNGLTRFRVLHLISCRSYWQSDHHGFGALGILAWPIMKPALQRSLTSWVQGNAWQMEFSSIPVHVCLVGKCCARSAFTTFLICCLLLALLVALSVCHGDAISAYLGRLLF